MKEIPVANIQFSFSLIFPSHIHFYLKVFLHFVVPLLWFSYEISENVLTFFPFALKVLFCILSSFDILYAVLLFSLVVSTVQTWIFLLLH